MTSTLPALAPTGRRPRLDRAGPLLPALTAAALAVVAIALRWRGGGYPAHF
jgi:hypothetical protein